MLNLKNRGVFWKEKPDCYVKMVWGKRPNARQPLSVEEEEILWKAGKLGKSSPVSLVHTMWFLNIQYFGHHNDNGCFFLEQGMMMVQFILNF